MFRLCFWLLLSLLPSTTEKCVFTVHMFVIKIVLASEG